MRSVLVVLALVFAALAAGAFAVSLYTAKKLDRGRMVRGEIPGASFFDATVASKRAVSGDPSAATGDENLPDQCELELTVTPPPPAPPRAARDWGDEAWCATVHTGDHVKVAVLPDDGAIYLQDGTWASPGNATFDRKLLGIERAAAGTSAVVGAALAAAAALLTGRRRRRSTAPRTGSTR